MTTPTDPAQPSDETAFAVLADIPCPDRMATLRAMLARAGDTFTLIDSPDQIPDMAQVLIVHMPAVDALAHALQQGQGVASAITEWRRRTEELLTFFRKNRRRTRILSDTTFLKKPSKWINAQTLTLPDNALPTLPSESDPLHILLAFEALRRDISARTLAGELEASAALGGPEPVEVDLDSVRQLHANREVEAEQLRQEQRQTQEHITVLQDEAAAVREEQAAVLRELMATQTRAQDARQAQATLAQEKQTLSEDLARRQEEKDRLEKQLHQLRQGLESIEAQLSTAQDDKTLLEREKRELTDRIEELASSLNAAHHARTELQALNASLQKDLADVQTEHAKATSELGKLTARLVERESDLEMLAAHHTSERQVQAEALENSQAALHEATRNLQARDAALEQLQAEKQARDSELGKLTARLKRREDELSRVYASKSHRITRPLRLLRAALRREK